MASYGDWLDGLTRYFFGPQFRKHRVRLIVTRGFLDQHFGYLGGTTSFLAAMLRGPEWALDATDRSMYAFGLALHAQWTRRRAGKPSRFEALEDVPPYLPYLCLLCLAWTEGQEEYLSPNAYFARLDKLFPGHGLASGLKDWCKLWDGLATWTERLKGAWGVFEVERLGGMPYVGIPKAQVILTPGKIERLPELFSALNLSPTVNISEDTMAHLVQVNERPACHCLGYGLVEQIIKETDIGKSAVKLLVEHLHSWDGHVAGHAKRVEGGTAAGGSVAAPVLLVLEVAANEANGWRLRFGVEEDKESEAVSFPDLRWRFQSVQPQLALAAAEGGSLVDAGGHLGDGEKVDFNGRWRDSGAFGEPPRYVFRARKAWFFDNWVGPDRLVESRRIANKEGVYILLTRQGLSQWQGWRAPHASKLEISDYTGTGLPASFTLLWVKGLAELEPSALAGLPGWESAAGQHPRVLWTSGGTLVRGSSARRMYADYDPPVVNLQGNAELSALFDGAEARPLSETSPQRGLPGEFVRSYALTIKPSASVVIVSAHKEGEAVIQEISFGIDRGGDTATALDSPHVDRLGDLFAGPGGVQGAAIPLRRPAWEFEEHVSDPGMVPGPEFYRHRALQMVESLHHHGGRMPIQEYRRRAFQVGGVEPWNLWIETRWLASLGHVEIQMDERGRWSHVHPVARQIYLLPWLHVGRRQAVVTGCGTLQHLRGLLAAAEKARCQVFVKEHGAKLVPPRVVLMHRDKAVLEVVSRQGGLAWNPQPAADAMAEWSGSLDDWLDSGSVRWHEREAPAGYSEYIPASFQMSNLDKNNAPARLFWMADPYAQGHFWHVLERQPAPNAPVDVLKRHAFLRDPAWAKWKAHLAVADEDTLVPFFKAEKAVVVPRELNLPYLLARALSLCNGLPPRRRRLSSAYADSDLGVLPEGHPRYEGECWEYLDVPRSIAEKVAGKLGGRLKDIKVAAPRR